MRPSERGIEKFRYISPLPDLISEIIRGIILN
jgi:hypothetical protein